MRTVLLLSLGLIAAPLAAQAPEAAPPPPAAGDHPRFDPARFQQMMAERRARRADDLAIVLALKPAQRPALDQWLGAMEPPFGPRGHGPDDKGPGERGAGSEAKAPMTTTERLDRDQAKLDERQQRARTAIDATRRFYATLDPQQQKVFDALSRLRHDHDGPGFGHGGHHGDGPPPPGMGKPGRK
jgi:hypothetical protein